MNVEQELPPLPDPPEPAQGPEPKPMEPRPSDE
jgi:hypothetical protein